MHLNISPFCSDINVLTHWGLVVHICVSKLAIIVSDDGLSPRRGQAIIWTNVGMLVIGTNFSEILIEIHTFHSRKCIQNIILSWPQCVNDSASFSRLSIKCMGLTAVALIRSLPYFYSRSLSHSPHLTNKAHWSYENARQYLEVSTCVWCDHVYWRLACWEDECTMA